MTREILIDLLKNYKERKASLELKTREKNMYEKRKQGCIEVEINTTSKLEINSDIRSKNKISDKVGEAVVNNIQKNDEIKKEAEEKIKELIPQIEILKSQTEEVEIRLKSLYPKEKELLTAYYIENRTYEEIGNILYFDLYKQTRGWEAIKKIVEKALNKMINL